MEVIAYLLLFFVVPTVSGFILLAATPVLVFFVSGRTGVLLSNLADGFIAGILGVALFEFLSLQSGFGVYFTLAVNFLLMEYRRRLMGRFGDPEIVISQLGGLILLMLII